MLGSEPHIGVRGGVVVGVGVALSSTVGARLRGVGENCTKCSQHFLRMSDSGGGSVSQRTGDEFSAGFWCYVWRSKKECTSQNV